MIHISMQTTLVWVTVLFSVICGNRLMDNRLLRPSSYTDSFQPSHRDLFPNFKEHSKSPSNDKLIGDVLPCRNNMAYDNKHELPSSRNCNGNWLDLVKPQSSYGSYDSVDVDVDADVDADRDALPTFNDQKFYGNSKTHEDLFQLEDGGINDRSKMLAPLMSALPVANYNDFYADLVLDSKKEMSKKRNGNSIGTPLGTPPARGCDCKVKNDLVDLGQQHFPRYLLNAICQSDDLAPKCWSGSVCRPLEYKVKVLTFRTLMDNMQKDLALAWLPDDLRQIWKFKTVTVTAGCFCS